MARSGITKTQVRAIRDDLLAQGLHPSVDAVRHGLGDVGSKSTIHRLLKELREEEGGDAPGIRREDTAGALAALVEQLAERLHADAEARIQALRQEHAQALAGKDRELALLREKVAALTDRLQLVEDDAMSAVPPRRRMPSGGFDGFGSFDSMLLTTRSAGHGGSPFTAVRTAARSLAPELGLGWPGRPS
ncbi:DNA-binding protein [Massilia sp. TN1-12]|uniref:DNA-binding protein n=1 Tax=Massilia paldalensis TaxID=3377675 RepID=UPI00384E0887